MIFYDLFRNDPHFCKVDAGGMLFRENDPGDGHMYVLLEGDANILIGNRVVESSQPGAIFGEMAMIENLPRSATVVAVTTCRFAVIDKKRFLFLVAETPHFATEVMRMMAQRLRSSDEKIDH